MISLRSKKKDELIASVAELKEQVASISAGRAGHMCPICMATFPAFKPYNKRVNARCPGCAPSERHRVSWLYLKDRTPLFKEPTRLLHFAPEPFLRRKIEVYITIDYTPASYDPDKPDEGIDMQKLPFADGSFDMVYTSHVLEHVPDDRKAMRELHRVLRSGGLAVIMVPIMNQPTTYEDATITSPEARLKAFGQHDHLRVYGRDFSKRVVDAGFEVETVYHHDAYSPELQAMYGIRPEPIFASRKR